MSAYLLVRANNLYGSYVDGVTPPLIDPKGAIVESRYAVDGYGTRETLPRYVRLYIDKLLDYLEPYQVAWRIELDLEVVTSDLPNDAFRVRIFATNPGANNAGAVVKEQVEQFLNDWNATVVSWDTNEVVADFSIYKSSISKAFFGLDAVAAVTFSEVSYDQPTATHVISADYTSTGANAINVDRKLRELGAVVLTHIDKVVTYEVTRQDVSVKFKELLQQFGNDLVQKRRYRITETGVDAAIAAGGEMTITEAQFLANLIDDAG